MNTTEAIPARPGRIGNVIHVIFPYVHNGLWVFDDADKGLEKEPFVCGADRIIDIATLDIPEADKGFTLLFSASPFQTARLTLDRVKADTLPAGQEPGMTGNTYYVRELNVEGWLCPALYRYFPTAPETIYAAFQPLKRKEAAV